MQIRYDPKQMMRQSEIRGNSVDDDDDGSDDAKSEEGKGNIYKGKSFLSKTN